MPLVRVNDVALYYETAGAGAPVVLVHGFACGIRSWDPQVRTFSPSRRIITYDVRGHGISEAPRDAAAYSEAISVGDLHGLLVSLGISRAAVGGLSMGGSIALNFAIAHPEMVTRLILADTGAGSDGREQWLAGVHALAEALEQQGMEPFADMACASPLFARYIAQGPAAERFIRSCLMTHRAHGLAHTAREALAKRPTIYELESRLRRLRVPTLLLVGEHDEPCLKVHRFMADCIQGSEHTIIRDSGHLTNLEAPAAFDEAMNHFLVRS
jgi:pimeloyl-ACP methyl ester carboxylesterase